MINVNDDASGIFGGSRYLLTIDTSWIERCSAFCMTELRLRRRDSHVLQLISTSNFHLRIA